MIEAHQNKSICREKTCAGVATTKGFGAEDLPRRMGVLATRIISVLLSQIRGVLSVCCRLPVFEKRGCGGGMSSAFLLHNVQYGGINK